VTDGPSPAPARPSRTLSIRVTLTLLAVGVALYVVGIAVFLAVRIAPRAAAVQAHDVEVLRAYDEMNHRADLLSGAVRELLPLLLMPNVRDTLSPELAHRLGARIARTLDSLDHAGAVAIEGGSVDLRVALARAIEAEAQLAARVRHTLAAIRVGRADEALADLRQAGALDMRARERLSAVERIALRDLVQRERDLSAAALSGVRVITVWVALGVVLIGGVSGVVHGRLYRPLRALDAGLARVAGGHLDRPLPVERDDEMGRLSRQFNEMTEVLRQRQEDERQRAQVAERQKGEEERARIFNLSVDLLLVAEVDGRVIQVNPAAQRILGFSPDDMVGRSLLEFIHPDDANSALAELAVLSSGRVAHGIRLRFLRADGAYRWIALSANPPEHGMFYAVGRDVTDEKVAEDHQLRLQMELERSAREWRQTFDAIDNAILILDRFGAVTRLNAAARKLAGRSYDDVLGRTLSMLGPDEPWIGAADSVAGVAAGGSPVWRQVRNAATLRTFDVNASPVPGVEQRTILVIRDITPLVQLQESLRRSETMSAMGQLVAGVAHEVRNPLFSMTATLDAFEARTGAKAEGARHLAVMRNQLVRLTHLMEDLLEYGKPPSVNLAPQPLEPLFAQAAEACAVLADQQGVLILRDLPRDVPPVMADKMRIVQVFANLLANAIQHSQAGSVVTLRAVPLPEHGDGSWVECAVLDSGSGFAAGDLPHLFEPFFTKRRGGTGLGLALVQRIVEQHGGTVTAANRPEGGAVMQVRLRSAAGGD
jgi:PAS domain S-box-containing protein